MRNSPRILRMHLADARAMYQSCMYKREGREGDFRVLVFRREFQEITLLSSNSARCPLDSNDTAGENNRASVLKPREDIHKS